MEASIANTERRAPIGSTLNYDAATDTYTDGDGQTLDTRGTEAFADFDPRGEGKGGPGVTTLKRVALFESLLRSAEERRGFLGRVDELTRSTGQGVGSPLEKAFYSPERNISDETFYEQYRKSLREGKPLTPEQLVAGLAGRGGGEDHRLGVLEKGGSEQALAVIRWEGSLAGKDTYTTVGLATRPQGVPF
jgi:hypothetical protein